jgi:hypothetical protein
VLGSSDEGNLVGLLLVDDLLTTLGFFTFGALGSLVAVEGTTEERDKGEDDDNNDNGTAGGGNVALAIVEGLVGGVLGITISFIGSLLGVLASIIYDLQGLGTRGLMLSPVLEPFNALGVIDTSSSSALEEFSDGSLRELGRIILSFLSGLGVGSVASLVLLALSFLNELVTIVDESVLIARSGLGHLSNLLGIDIGSLLAQVVVNVPFTLSLRGRFSHLGLGFSELILGGLLTISEKDLLNGGSVGRGGGNESSNSSELHV